MWIIKKEKGILNIFLFKNIKKITQNTISFMIIDIKIEHRLNTQNFFEFLVACCLCDVNYKAQNYQWIKN